jgi:transposase-like protein
MMPKKRPTYEQRIPLAHEGIQINFCKNPECFNFGIPALENIKGLPLPSVAGGCNRNRDNYTIVGEKNLRCHFCGQEPPMKSNKGIYDEFSRMWAYLEQKPPRDRACPNEKCSNSIGKIEVSSGSPHYHKDGKNKSGAQRYVCRACDHKFSLNDNPAAGQKKSSQNDLIFRLLVNKMPLQRICEVVQISMSTLYSKIDFLFEQCQAFAASHERNLPNLSIRRLQISVDRQDYIVNWDDTLDKRNVIIHALGSSDNRSGFVFGMHPNIDPAVKREVVEEDAKGVGDYDRKPPFRQYARYWLAPDFNQPRVRVASKKSGKQKLIESIAETYAEAELRQDIEAFDEMSADVTVSRTGMQVHGEYTMYGHFVFLKHLLQKTEKIRFYMEKESGMRAACLSAFAEDIRNGRVDAFYVKINKEMTISQKNTAMAIGRRELEAFRAASIAYEDVEDHDLRAFMFTEKIEGGQFFFSGKYKDKWYLYPAPPKNEPEKAVSWLTDTGGKGYAADHLAKLMLRASLFGIDRYFMQVRRRISLLERPISSSSATGARWYGYSPYNPVVIAKILEIFRVYHNYISGTSDMKPRKLQEGEKKRNPGEARKTYSTPAMRLGRVESGTVGLVDRKFEVEDVLEFVSEPTE